MKISIKLYGALRQNHFKEKVLEVPEGLTVAQITDMFTLSDKLIGAVVINGSHVVMEDVLRDGDELIILPLMDGG